MRLVVRPYSFDTLKKLLQTCSDASVGYVQQKLQSNYFKNYFEQVSAQTIVVESDYTDRDFLEDFASYFVRCFRSYEKTCTRLHFFSAKFKAKELEALLRGDGGSLSQESLQAAYLGFTVVKRLPQTFLGRTCLLTYPLDGGRRHYVVRPYEVSLYGLNLTVDSLAFQEQDTVAGACATSALWSVFQGTGEVFHHHIPSPVEVSNYAERAHAAEARRSPSRGLTDDQAFEAIRQVDLEPSAVDAKEREVFVRTAYAYLRGGVPAYLGVNIWHNKGGPTGDVLAKDIEFDCAHATALVGYSLGLAAGSPDVNQVQLRAYRMDKVYVHDDQVGPFARAEFKQRDFVAEDGSRVDLFTLQTSWPSNRLIAPDRLILALYHKVRIPFETAYLVITRLDRVMKPLLQHAKFNTSDLEWDIYMTTTNQVKEELLTLSTISNERRLELVTTPLPRFLWKARLFLNGEPVLTLLLDATDIEQGHMVAALWQEGKDRIHDALRMIAASPTIKAAVQVGSQWRIWESIETLR